MKLIHYISLLPLYKKNQLTGFYMRATLAFNWLNSRKRFYLWQNLGLMRYANENAAVNNHCVAITVPLKKNPGLRIDVNVIRCMRSFSASSSSVWIQPWSLFIFRKLWRCRIIAAAKPGTPRWKTFFLHKK